MRHERQIKQVPVRACSKICASCPDCDKIRPFAIWRPLMTRHPRAISVKVDPDQTRGGQGRPPLRLEIGPMFSQIAVNLMP